MSDPLAHFPQISLRIADELHDRLTQAAKTAQRPLAEEVTARLEASFLRPAPAPESDRQALLERLHRLEDLVDQVDHDAQA